VKRQRGLSDAERFGLGRRGGPDPCWCGLAHVSWMELWDDHRVLSARYPVCRAHGCLASWSVQMKVQLGESAASFGDEWWEDEHGDRIGAAVYSEGWPGAN